MTHVARTAFRSHQAYKSSLPYLASVPAIKAFHTSLNHAANPLPNTAAGPPPSAPVPAASQYGERVDRRRRQAEMLKRGQELRANLARPGNAMKRRFWRDVVVKSDSEGSHVIYLDARPVRNPSTKTPLPIPTSKPHLATGIALEWDLLTSAQQALRPHLIPLTSIASRAHDISLQDSSYAESMSSLRVEIMENLIRYLDTDTLLSWAPEPVADPDGQVIQPSLRELQIRTALPIIGYLSQNVWPGVELRPTFDSGSILPTAQPAATQAVIKGWIAGLPAWELAGLERAVLAGKSLCVAARLVCEWSEEYRSIQRFTRNDEGQEERFGIEQAAEACSLELRWQTGRWGEVEDTHDVEREDIKRQFGSTVLVVSGTKGPNA